MSKFLTAPKKLRNKDLRLETTEPIHLYSKEYKKFLAMKWENYPKHLGKTKRNPVL